MRKPNWLAMEREMHEVLGSARDCSMCERDALRCIDEILARYTGRGNTSHNPGEEELLRLEGLYPTYFDWENLG